MWRELSDVATRARGVAEVGADKETGGLAYGLPCLIWRRGSSVGHLLRGGRGWAGVGVGLSFGCTWEPVGIALSLTRWCAYIKPCVVY